MFFSPLHFCLHVFAEVILILVHLLYWVWDYLQRVSTANLKTPFGARFPDSQRASRDIARHLVLTHPAEQRMHTRGGAHSEVGVGQAARGHLDHASALPESFGVVDERGQDDHHAIAKVVGMDAIAAGDERSMGYGGAVHGCG